MKPISRHRCFLPFLAALAVLHFGCAEELPEIPGRYVDDKQETGLQFDSHGTVAFVELASATSDRPTIEFFLGTWSRQGYHIEINVGGDTMRLRVQRRGGRTQLVVESPPDNLVQHLGHKFSDVYVSIDAHD